MTSNNNFNNILNRKECSEAEYIQFRTLFDDAVNAGLISSPEKFQKTMIEHGLSKDIHYSYRWELNR